MDYDLEDRTDFDKRLKELNELIEKTLEKLDDMNFIIDQWKAEAELEADDEIDDEGRVEEPT